MKSNINQNRSALFSVFSKVSIILSAATVVYAIYHLFFFAEQTWLHGSISTAWGFLFSFLWLLILLVFRILLNKRLHYRKANVLINLYLIFTAVITWLVYLLLYDMLGAYFSPDEGLSIDNLPSFVGQTLSRGVLLFLTGYASYLFIILIGIKLAKIKMVESKLFTLLGSAMIMNGVLHVADNFTDPDLTIAILLVNAAILYFIGLLFKKINVADLSPLFPQKTDSSDDIKTTVPSQKIVSNVSISKSELTSERTTLTPQKTEVSTKKTPTREMKSPPKKTRKAAPEATPLPLVDLEKITDIALVRNYYQGLSVGEKQRLETIIEQKYSDQHTLSDSDRLNLIFQYIAERKLHDHQRYFPGS